MMSLAELIPPALHSASRILLIVAVTFGAHLAVVGVRWLSRRLLRSAPASQAKLQTLTGFGASVLVFVLYFLALGFVLRELGISLTAYLASASIIGLAVSFGSQGLVQDVIMGLTVVFSDLLDVGDIVEMGGQVGIVESVGIRFTVIVSFTGAQIYVPNRTIANVINYPRGYVRAFLDVRLPDDPRQAEAAQAKVKELTQAAYEQFPGILLLPPSIEAREETSAGYAYLRVKFRIWPGQGALVETTVKQSLVQALRELDSAYADWMVAVHYRAEPRSKDPERRLPRPAVLRRRTDDHRS
jgi:small-conductance mechanosensitive channel